MKEMKEDKEKIRRLVKKRKGVGKTEMNPEEKYVENLMKKENEADSNPQSQQASGRRPTS